MCARRRAVLAAFSLASVLTCAAANAQRPEGEEALRLFEEGTALNKEGRAQEACAVLARSLELERSINAYFQLGKCNETLSRFHSASEAYGAAAEMSQAAGDAAREKVARDYASKLTPRVPSLRITLEEPDEDDLSVYRNGTKVPEEDWGKPMRVDPGEITVEARAPGKRSFSKRVTAPATAAAVTVHVPPLRDAEDGDGGSYESVRRRSTPLFATGIALIGAGGVGTLVGVVGLGTDSSVEFDDDAAAGWIGVTVAGVALLGAGIPLTIIFGKKVPIESAATPSANEVRAALYATPTGGGFTLDF